MLMADENDNRDTYVIAPLALYVMNGPEAGRRIAIQNLPMIIGRGGRSRSPLLDPDDPPAVSRDHATISFSSGHLVITDHSVNGTRVNDHWLHHRETCEIHSGDTVGLGPSLMLQLNPSKTSETPNLKTTPSATIPHRNQLRNTSPKSLKEFITNPDTLLKAWHRVELNHGAAGPDDVSIRDYSENAGKRLENLRSMLIKGTYSPLPPRLFTTPKRSGGARTIAILSIQDRIVQQALHAALLPLIEPLLPDCSYAYRPGRCAHHALSTIEGLLKSGQNWVAETDIDSFFDSISHAILLDKLSSLVLDPFTLTLISRCISSGNQQANKGIHQGAATSPLFSNLFLAEYDKHMISIGCNLIRYGDDMVIICGAKGEAELALAETEGFLKSKLGLSLKPDKTFIKHLHAGFTFLGFRFDASGRKPSPASIVRLNEKLVMASPDQSPAIIRGWHNYYRKDSTPFILTTEQIIHNDESDVMEISKISDDDIQTFLSFFSGREDVFAYLGHNGNNISFLSCSGHITSDIFRKHLAGEETLSIYPLRLDGTIRTVVIDVDSAPGIHPKDCMEEDHTKQAGLVSESIGEVCRKLDIPHSLEYSGKKGYHIWLFFSEPISAETGRRLARLILSELTADLKKGVHIEVFPRHTEWTGPELGDAIKLPFGVHPVSGRRCLFLTDDGEFIPSLDRALKQMRSISAENAQLYIHKLKDRSQPKSARLEKESAAIRGSVFKLLDGCGVIRTLADRAFSLGHLRHIQRLILLYTLGRMGEEGKTYLRKCLSACSNYKETVSEKYLASLDESHPCITCRRIKEWLEEDNDEIICNCSFQLHSPLDLLASEPKPIGKSNHPRSLSRPIEEKSDEDLEMMRQVLSDMFEESAMSEEKDIHEEGEDRNS